MSSLRFICLIYYAVFIDISRMLRVYEFRKINLPSMHSTHPPTHHSLAHPLSLCFFRGGGYPQVSILSLHISIHLSSPPCATFSLIRRTLSLSYKAFVCCCCCSSSFYLLVTCRSIGGGAITRKSSSSFTQWWQQYRTCEIQSMGLKIAFEISRFFAWVFDKLIFESQDR